MPFDTETTIMLVQEKYDFAPKKLRRPEWPERRADVRRGIYDIWRKEEPRRQAALENTRKAMAALKRKGG